LLPVAMMSETVIPDNVKEILSRLPDADRGMCGNIYNIESNAPSFFSPSVCLSGASSLHRRNL